MSSHLEAIRANLELERVIVPRTSLRDGGGGSR
jgi:hypothetical protein